MSKHAKDTTTHRIEIGDVDVEERAHTLLETLLSLPCDTDDVLVELGQAERLDGGTLAVLLAAAHEFGTERSIAVAAPSHISDSLREWRVDALVPVFADEDLDKAAG